MRGGWRAASPQLRRGVGQRPLPVPGDRTSLQQGQRPTCHPAQAPPSWAQEQLPCLCGKARRWPWLGSISQPGGPTPPVKTPSRTETETGLRGAYTAAASQLPVPHISTGVSLSPVNTAPLPSHPTPRLSLWSRGERPGVGAPGANPHPGLLAPQWPEPGAFQGPCASWTQVKRPV